MSEDKLSRDAARAARAQSLLDNDLLQEAYAKIEEQLIAAWINTPARDDDGRKRAWDAVHANRKHKEYLQSVLNNGKLAAAELKQLAEAADRRRFRII